MNRTIVTIQSLNTENKPGAPNEPNARNPFDVENAIMVPNEPNRVNVPIAPDALRFPMAGREAKNFFEFMLRKGVRYESNLELFADSSHDIGRLPRASDAGDYDYPSGVMYSKNTVYYPL